MRKFFACAVIQIALLTGIGYGQAGAVTKPPNDPQTLLKAAAPHYDYFSDNMKPWHLKATYQFYDAKGKPAEQGKWEYWWASPKVYRRTWTRNNVTQSDWYTADGSYHKQEGGSLRYFERNISNILFKPLPPEKAIESGRMKLDLKMTSVGQMQLACVSAALQPKNNEKLAASSLPGPGVYCFSPSSEALRVFYDNYFIYEYDQLVKTQNRYLSKQVVVMYGNRKLFSVAIDTIEGISLEDSALALPAGAEIESESSQADDSNHDDGGVTVGKLIKKIPPDYPETAKMARQQGIVVMAAVIGTDGKIHDLETLFSPSQLLTKSAEDAVKKWEYKPNLLNGNPVEVETIVNVTFSLGG